MTDPTRTGESAERTPDWCEDDNGTARCALPVFWTETPGGVSWKDCGAELYVDWSFTVPIGPGQEVVPRHVHIDAVSSGWQVVCTNGHVLRVSGNSQTAEDYAEPCIFDHQFTAPHFGGSAESQS